MRARPCPQEEVVLAAALDRAQAAPSDEMSAHLEACGSCRDLYAMVSALREDGAMAMAEARVPSAGQAWWRAELRARQEAATAAARPITVATGLAAASLLGLFASLAGVLAWWFPDRPSVSSALHAALGSVAAAAWPAQTGLGLVAWLVAAALVLATPIVLFVALRED